MKSELDILKIVIERLDKADIPYMLTGSMAANFYTVPRMTRDIDIVIEISERDVERLSSLFSADFYIDKEAIKKALGGRQMFNIIHTEAVVKVDFIIRKDIEYRKVEFNRRRKMEFEGRDIYVVSPEDLLISKLFWAKESMSGLQIGDVMNLLETVGELDREYIEKWVNKLELEDVWKAALA